MSEADVKVEAKLGLRGRLTHWQVKVVALLPREAGTPELDCYGQARFDSFFTQTIWQRCFTTQLESEYSYANSLIFDHGHHWHLVHCKLYDNINIEELQTGCSFEHGEYW